MMWKSQILRVPTIVSPLATAVTPSIIYIKASAISGHDRIVVRLQQG